MSKVTTWMALLVLALLPACDGGGGDGDGDADVDGDADMDGDGDTDEAEDGDNDGYPAGEDCDDSDPEVNPGAEEVCDGLDNDCDGEIDEGLSQTWYEDDDGDGFGDDGDTLEDCGQPEGYVEEGGDCDDADPDTFPGAGERCDDRDNDCDGETDEDVVTEWFADADRDGFGDPGSPFETCDPPPGYVADDSDCDDLNPAVNPEAEEVCDGLDNDCNGEIDDGAPTETFYADADGDGFGDAETTVEGCEPPAGYVAEAGDCDDADAASYPGGAELCDGADNDCDGEIDEGVLTTFYLDADGDGFGLDDSTTMACAPPEGYAAVGGDCDDSDGAINPDAAEVCDGADNDCDGEIDGDDALGRTTFYADADGDGFGDPEVTTRACAAPEGYVDNAADCDDAEAAINPEAEEVCDEVDNDCDGDVDDEDSGLADGVTWYIDYDGDGFGAEAFTEVACLQPRGYVATADDCDDREVDVNPEADEVCDEIDNDCDDLIDDDDPDMIGEGTATFYADEDGDGYGDPESTVDACELPEGYVANDEDCDDSDEEINPDGDEVCDGEDNDCDGTVDNEELVLGGGEACAAESCLDIITARPAAADGVYYVQPEGAEEPFEAFCEMTFEGGGWLVVFNMMRREETYEEAAAMHATITRNEPMVEPVLPDSTSRSIFTSNIPLENYTEVVYGWAPTSDEDVTRYATYEREAGMAGECYIDGYCGAGVTIARMTVVPTGTVRDFQTGNSPSYPHVGIGWSGQIICWGFDRNFSSNGPWANWYDTKPCCTSGNTPEVRESEWRYVIYIR